MVTSTSSLTDLIGALPDPELPILTIGDLGILRRVEVTGNEARVTITPTYIGCPAIEAIAEDVVRAAATFGFNATIAIEYAPWTTDWVSAEGRRKLADAGIAPPGAPPSCPQCAGREVSTISHFGSSACKALLLCDTCGEPFDLFKEL